MENWLEESNFKIDLKSHLIFNSMNQVGKSRSWRETAWQGPWSFGIQNQIELN
jgi:hypothetical protein